MKKTINFASLTKLMLIIAAAVVAAGALVLVLLGGNTVPNYGFSNLTLGLVFRCVAAAVLVFALVLIYFVIRFKKAGLKMAFVSTAGACVNALVAFALCVICRANLGDMAFAVTLLAVILSYITFILFAYSFQKKVSRKKTDETEVDAYSAGVNKVWKIMLLTLVLICVILLGALVASLIYGAGVYAFYAIPAILTAVFSVVFTLAFTCKLFADKA